MPEVTRTKFGNLPSGDDVNKYVLRNSCGTMIELIDYGATITSIHTKDKFGKFDDIVLGFDDMNGYGPNPPYFGSTIGRVANRIAGGQFSLDGQTYKLAVNCGGHHLHGGLRGFSKQLWFAETRKEDESASVIFTLTSSDGEDGYPGTLDVTATFTLTNSNELKIEYTAKVREKATPINMTNHAYFNLGGQVEQNVLDHDLQIMADDYLPCDDTCCPTGEKKSVAGKDDAFDFRVSKLLGQDIAKTSFSGYDNTFCLKGDLAECCTRVTHHSSGRVLEVFTNQPGIQLYTMNISEPMKGKNGLVYNRYSAFCLETQNYPNAINQDNFPNCILRPGEEYNNITVYKFSVVD